MPVTQLRQRWYTGGSSIGRVGAHHASFQGTCRLRRIGHGQAPRSVLVRAPSQSGVAKDTAFAYKHLYKHLAEIVDVLHRLDVPGR